MRPLKSLKEKKLPADLTKKNDSLVPTQGEKIAIARTRYFQMLENPDDYSDIAFSTEEITTIKRRISHLSTGAFARIPLSCWPERCPFRENCPFVAIGKAPGKGRACLLETNLLKEWTISFIREYDIHPDSITDRIYVQELAECELLLYRINSNLSKPENAELVGDQAVGMSREGDAITRKEILALMDLKLRIQGRKDKIVKMMVGDREGKYKKQAALKEKEGGDMSSNTASLKKELQQIEQQARQMKEKLREENSIDASFEKTPEEVPLTPDDLIGELS